MRSPLAASPRALSDDAPALFAVANLKDARRPARGAGIGPSMLAPALPPVVVTTSTPGLIQVSAE
jgi:hypothetical protein